MFDAINKYKDGFKFVDFSNDTKNNYYLKKTRFSPKKFADSKKSITFAPA